MPEINPSSNIETIWVKLLEEGSIMWRPVEARNLGGGVFQIVSPEIQDEVWEFPTGSKVAIEIRKGDRGEYPAAVRTAT